jgi:pimeloyl-ACP methyl ester carboxylesterase
MPPEEIIVFVHGIGRTPLSLVRIILAAKKRGYRTLAWKYPSRKKSGLQLAKDLGQYIQRHIPANSTKVHFVTHSLGGYIVTLYLKEGTSIPSGRVVMIAPPLGGSEIVDQGMSWPLFQEFFGPVISELQTRPASAVDSGLHNEVAVIAGERTQWPWSLLFDEPNDGKVSVTSTRQINATEHVVLPYNHTELTFRAEVVDKTLQFIKTGSMN